MALSIWVPVGYIGALVLSLSLFSSVYRKRSAKNLAKGHSEPWFPEGHQERDVYQSLVEASASGKKVPDEILKAALLARAMTDVKRIVQMRDDKQALGVLLQKGSIGDETTARFALAEKELEAEILDVVSEANTFREGWGQIIFPTASEMVTHMKHKDVYHAIPEERKKQVAALTAMGKPVPKPTITLPPLFTPPGTQVTVQGPPGAQQQQQQQQAQQQQQQQIPTPEQQQQIAQALAQYPLPPPLQQALMQAQAQGQPPPPPLQQALAAHVQEARRRFMESQGQSANVQSSPAKAGPEVAASSTPTNVNGAGASETAADAVAGGPPQHLQPPSTPLRPSSNANSQEQSPVPSTPGSDAGIGDADGGDDDDDNGDGGDGMNRAQRRQNKKNKKKGKK